MRRGEGSATKVSPEREVNGKTAGPMGGPASQGRSPAQESATYLAAGMTGKESCVTHGELSDFRGRGHLLAETVRRKPQGKEGGVREQSERFIVAMAPGETRVTPPESGAVGVAPHR